MAEEPAPARRVMSGPALLSHYATRAIRSNMRAPAMPHSDGRLRMLVQRHRTWMVPALALFLLTLTAPAWAGGFPGGVRDALGPLFDAAPPRRAAPHSHDARGGAEAMHQLRHRNGMAMNASGLDHTPVTSGEDRIFGEQYGPTRASRAMAFVHIAIFEAVNAIAGGYQSYTGLPPVHVDTSMDAAIAQAAHDTLVALYPSQSASFDAQLADDLSQGRDQHGRAQAHGIRLGQRAARAILALRARDGSDHAEPRVGIEFITGDEPGQWRQDPISQLRLALGAYWGGVTPFVLRSAAQFRVPPPPALESPEYATAFDEVQ